MCATGDCLRTCQTNTDCPGGLTCCGDHCAALDRDAKHCGSCDGACSSAEFCVASSCRPGTISHVCDNPGVTLLRDDLPVDDMESDEIARTMPVVCTSQPTSNLLESAGTGLINPTTKAPITKGGNTVISVGGPLGQKPLAYLDSAKITPVYARYDDTRATFYGRAAVPGDPDPVLARDFLSDLTADHDYFVIEGAVEPTSSTPCFAIYGFFGPGTSAASWYFINKVLADPTQYPKSYYIIEWTDGDGNHQPGAADTFTEWISG